MKRRKGDRSGTRLETVLDALTAMMLVVDARTRIHDFHPRDSSMVPGLGGELLGSRLVDLLPEEPGRAVASAIDSAALSGFHSGTVLELEAPHGPAWFELCVSHVEDPSAAPDAPYVLILRDVSERVRMERSMRESESRYRMLFESTGTGSFIMEDDFTITLVNEEFEKVTGFSRDQVLGKMKGTDFLLPDYDSMAKRYHAMRKTDPESVPKKYEVKVKDRTGSIHDGIVTVEMIPGTNRRVVSFVDTTDLKTAEKQMYRFEKMAALGQLITGVAHEIKNPNHLIYVNVPVLEEYIQAMEEILDQVSEKDSNLQLLNMPYEEYKEDLQKILDNMLLGSERITEIVSELRAYASLDDEGKKRPGSIHDVLEHVMTMVGKQVRKSVSSLELHVESDLPQVMMDPGGVEQVLTNLLINAGHATDGKDDAQIRVEVGRSARDARFIEILVRDNGCGIPSDVMEKIFEPYFTTKQHDMGTGLGLWISHRIVEDHGGTLNVSSTVAEGTTFTIELPCCPDPGPD